MSDTRPGRDFSGYRGGEPPVRWLDGARLAVSLVVNFEEGAELSLGMGDETNESVHEVSVKVEGARDLCMESHFEYGTRVGWPRLRDVLRKYGVPATVSANGRAVLHSPWIAREAVEDGHEVSCHGWRWERHAGFREDHEREVIARTFATIREACGVAPVGWHTKSSPSENTRRLLVEHGGFLYDSDAYNDDCPYFVGVAGGRHLVLPYAFDTNDMRFTNQGGFVFAQDFATYCIDAFDRLYEEGASAPRMMSVGLHLRIIGRPGRIAGLERFLDHALGRPGVWFARRADIARHWMLVTDQKAE